jgi:hypothetical protein
MKKMIVLFLFGWMAADCTAQIQTGMLFISGSAAYEKIDLRNTPEYSITTIKPELGYVVYYPVSVQLLLDTKIYRYPRDWGGHDDMFFGIGYGVKGFYHQFYVALNHLRYQWNETPARYFLLYEAGYLLRVFKSLYVDLGLEFQQGVGKVEHGNEYYRTELGIVFFVPL